MVFTCVRAGGTGARTEVDMQQRVAGAFRHGRAQAWGEDVADQCPLIKGLRRHRADLPDLVYAGSLIGEYAYDRCP